MPQTSKLGSSATFHMSSSSRKRKQAALPSDLPPAASKGGHSGPQELSEPTGTKHVPCHSGALGPDGKLVRFKDAPAHFRPGLTPRQMLLAGMHGGIYFNPKGGSAQPQPIAATLLSASYPSQSQPSLTLANPRRPLWLAEPGVKYPRSKYPKGIPGVTTSEFPPEWLEGVPKELYLSRRYSTTHNKHHVKSGLDQAALEAVTLCTQAVTLSQP